MRQRREGDRGADKSLEFICPRDHPDGWLVLHSPKLMVILCQDYLIIESFFQTLSRIPVPSLQSRSFFFSQIPLLPSPSSLTYISPPPSSSYNCKPNKLSIFIMLLIKWQSLIIVHITHYIYHSTKYRVLSAHCTLNSTQYIPHIA